MSSSGLASSSIRHRTPQRQVENGASTRGVLSSPSRKSSIESITSTKEKSRLHFPFLRDIRRAPSQTSISKVDRRNSDEHLLKTIADEQTRLHERLKALEQDKEGPKAVHDTERDERIQNGQSNHDDTETSRRETWNVIESSLKRDISQLQHLVDGLTAQLSNTEREFKTYKDETERMGRGSEIAQMEERNRTASLHDAVRRVEGREVSVQNRLNSFDDKCADLKQDIEKVKNGAEKHLREIGRLKDRISSCETTLQALQSTYKDQYTRRSYLLLAIVTIVIAVFMASNLDPPKIGCRPIIP